MDSAVQTEAADRQPRTPAPRGGARPDRSRRRRRLVLGALAGCLALGGVLVPVLGERGRPPGPLPGAQADTAVRAGVAAALPDLAALIDEREDRVRERPGDGEAWAVLGAAYLERGRRTADAAVFYPKAERALRMSLKVRPHRNAEALTGLAALANARRDFRAARAWGEAARKPAPKQWTTYAQLIDAYTGLGDHKKARSALDRMTALRSGTAVRGRAAAAYRNQGWREDAAAALSDAAAGAATAAEEAAWRERAGQLAFERGDTEAALRYFREAVRLDADQRAAQAGQGRVLAALGRTTEAVGAYRSALARQPLPGYALELGELYESLGMVRAARVQYDLVRTRVRREAAGGVDGDLVLGRLEADHGDPAEAVRRLRAEWRRQPGVEVADALGWALHRAGRDAEALRYAMIATDRAHGGAVRSAPYAYHRGMIELGLRKQGPARRYLTEALRINPYFSLSGARAARTALAELGEPSPAAPPEVTATWPAPRGDAPDTASAERSSRDGAPGAASARRPSRDDAPGAASAGRSSREDDDAGGASAEPSERDGSHSETEPAEQEGSRSGTEPSGREGSRSGTEPSGREGSRSGTEPSERDGSRSGTSAEPSSPGGRSR